MTSKERVKRCLERKEIDRIPIDLQCGGINSAYNALTAYFKANDAEDLYRKMEIDIRGISPSYIGPTDEGRIAVSAGSAAAVRMESIFGGSEYVKCDYDGSGGIAGTYADNVGSRPFRHFTTVRQIESYAWPSADWFEYSSLIEDCNRHRNFAIRCGGWAPILSRVFELFGMETALIHMHESPNLIHATIEKAIDYYYEFYDRALHSAGDGIMIVGFGDDFASQRDLLISPEMWRTFCKKPLERLFSLGKKHGAYVFFHSCGAIRSIIPDLIETGMDILFPIQPNARGMDHRELKREFCNDLAFWGGIDVQTLLPFGTPQEVQKAVRERIEVLGEGGGYILSSSHNLLTAFPLQNILAMYDEASKTI